MVFSPPEVLYSAPGAGVGHLTRAYALCSRLAKKGVACRVVTNSIYAQGFARLSGLAIDYIPSRRWLSVFPSYLAEIKPRLVLLDTFPWGVRGEWKDFSPPGVEFIYLARRLKLENYLSALGMKWERASEKLRKVIVLEPLTAEHEALLQTSGAELYRLPGRVRLPEELPGPPFPPRLRELWERGELWLVVHSGPESEIKKLVALAREKMGKRKAPLALISPRPMHSSARGVEWFEYYPAQKLFARVFRIVTGGGYNLVAETHEFREKHLALAFPRKFDDQAGRLKSPPMSAAKGGDLAAQFIAHCL